MARLGMKVMCAVDGSEYSRWAVEALRVIAAHPPDSLCLVHVVEPRRLPNSAGPSSPARMSRVTRALDERGSTLLREMSGLASVSLGQGGTSARIKIDTALAHGRPATSIVNQARRRRADLLVLGSRGLSDIRGFLLGSVSRYVSVHTSCPTWIIKRPITPLGQVVLAVDASNRSRAACEYLCAHIVNESTHVSVLAVAGHELTEMAARMLPATELQHLVQPQIDRAHQLVESYRDRILTTGCSVTTEVVTGHPSESILTHAKETHADVIVVGSRGLEGTERLRLGSVAEHVLKYAPCSVLIVRRRAPRLEHRSPRRGRVGQSSDGAPRRSVTIIQDRTLSPERRRP